MSDMDPKLCQYTYSKGRKSKYEDKEVEEVTEEHVGIDINRDL